jgi:methyl-accepting chemotaxis protein
VPEITGGRLQVGRAPPNWKESYLSTRSDHLVHRTALSRLLSLPLRAKLLTTVGVACVVALVIGVVGLAQLGALDQRSQDIKTHALGPTDEMAQVRRTFLQTRIDSLADELIPDTTGAEHNAFLADVDKVNAAFADLRDDTVLTGTQRALLDQADQAWKSYADVVGGRLLQLAHSGNMQAFMTLRIQQVKPVSATLNAALDSLEKSLTAQGDASVTAATSAYHSARTLILIVLIVGVAIALALGVFVAGLVIRPVIAVRNGLVAMAAGDLTARVDVTSRDEVGQMAEALNEASGSLRATVQSTAESAQALAAAAEELTSSAEAISGSAEEAATQAGTVAAAAEQISRNVQTVAAGSEEMGASINEIAQNAAEAARVAGSAVQAAETTTQTVTTLGISSQEIGEVV